MIQIPNAVGLILCEKTITEEGTKNVTLVNTFVRLKQKVFPTPPLQFLVYAFLTDGLGDVPYTLILSRLDTLEELMEGSAKLRFNNPLSDYHLRWRLPPIQFPNPGRHAGDEIAQRVLQLIAWEK
jgi:hypothetical protein